jgi:hypothetical protein
VKDAWRVKKNEFPKRDNPKTLAEERDIFPQKNQEETR